MDSTFAEEMLDLHVVLLSLVTSASRRSPFYEPPYVKYPRLFLWFLGVCVMRAILAEERW